MWQMLVVWTVAALLAGQAVGFAAAAWLMARRDGMARDLRRTRRRLAEMARIATEHGAPDATVRTILGGEPNAADELHAGIAPDLVAR
jgi:hypothetical protein